MFITQLKRLTALILVAIISYPLFAQTLPDESFRIKLESTLFRFKNWRFSNISLYQLKSISDVTKAIQTKDTRAPGAEIETTAEGVPECVKIADELIRNSYQRGVQSNWSQSRIERELVARNIPLPDKSLRDCLFNYYQSMKAVGIKRIRNCYLVTTRVPKGEYMPNVIIGMIVSYEDEEQIERNIDRASPSDIYTYDELRQFDLDPKQFGAATLYDLLMNAFMQNNVINRTLEAQGIGTLLTFAPKTFGVTKSLIREEANALSEDVQTFMRISEGQPNDIQLKEHEVIVSPDYISWRRYELFVIEYSPGEFDTVSIITNQGLPKYGIELRYGIEDINYPSLWSERMTIRALWENVKLGLVLPTNGWASLSKDAFNIDRRLTFGGWGVSGEADFPFKVIRNSGVFKVSGAYVFGDAKEADYKNRGLNIDNYETIYPLLDDYGKYDYLIRANGQLHYTFGVSIDEDYLLRFGLGGTVYNAEKWTLQPNEDRDKIIMKKIDDETVGGISGRVEFMSKNAVTPYGGSVQYFDEAIIANLWLQIPVVQNTFALKIDVKGYWTAFRDKLHPWEKSNVFIPMVRAIINF